MKLAAACGRSSERRERSGVRHEHRRLTVAQSSYLSVNDRRLHFGLGDAASANLEIRWPNGALVENVPDVAADQLVVIREGSGIIRTDQFRRR